ncbi:hypothetical protein D3C85_1341290 [compost metagenome]
MSNPVRLLSDYINAITDPTLEKYAAYRLVGCKDITEITRSLKQTLKICLGAEAYKFRYFWLNTSIGIVIAFSGDARALAIIANRLCDYSRHFTRADELHAGGGVIRFKAYMQEIEMMYRPIPRTRSYAGSAVQMKARPRKARTSSASPND